MAKVCLETAAQNPESLERIALYFELWILRLGGYLPDWNHCDNCRRNLDAGQPVGLQINFHLLCQACHKNRSNWLISHEQRQIFNYALKLSPDKFVECTETQTADVREVSSILRRLISNILGKETVGEKILTASLQSR